MARCLVVQHLEPEEPYAIADAIRAAGAHVETCATFAGCELPRDASGLDGLVVMGGPMSARSDDGFPTRRQEIALLADAVARGVPTLGVCLGAQLLAAAAGGEVLATTVGPEVGWGPVTLTADAARDPLFAGLPTSLTVLHWHGETYRRPSGAPLLASSAQYPEQAFRVGPTAWGLQFHVEVDLAGVAAFVDAFPDEAGAAAGGVEELRSRTAGAVEGLEWWRDRLLSRFARLVVDREAVFTDA